MASKISLFILLTVYYCQTVLYSFCWL